MSHGALLRIYGDDEYVPDQLVANYRGADVSERHRAMLDVAVKLTDDPDALERSDLDCLETVGFTEEEIWDIGMVTSFFNLSNRMAIFTDNRPNEEFHSMGRS